MHLLVMYARLHFHLWEKFQQILLGIRDKCAHNYREKG